MVERAERGLRSLLPNTKNTIELHAADSFIDKRKRVDRAMSDANSDEEPLGTGKKSCSLATKAESYGQTEAVGRGEA